MKEKLKSAWEKVKSFLSRHWKCVAGVAVAVVAALLGMRFLSCGGGETTTDYDPNSRAEGREQGFGETDEHGYEQVPVMSPEGDSVEVEDAPEGVDRDDVRGRTTVSPRTDPSDTETHSEPFMERERNRNDRGDHNRPVDFTDDD